MINTIEVKAIDKEKAIERALKILDINLNDNQEAIVVEKVKPKKKLFGLLGIENGIYQVTIQNKEKKNINDTKNVSSKNPKKEIKKEVKIEKKVEKKEVKEVKEVKKETEIKKVKEEKKEVKDNLKKELVKKSETNEKSLDEEKEIYDTAKELLTRMELELDIEIKKIKERSYLINLSGKDNAIIIGQKGKTLNSFEYILNSLLTGYRIEVDVEKFKEKRHETLRVLGKRMAEKVLKTNKTVRLNSMPARERKIIHEIVNSYEGLDTFSEGRDPKRYIVIKKKR